MRVQRFAFVLSLCLLVASSAYGRIRDHLMCYKSKADFDGVSAYLDDDFDPNAPGDANAFYVKKVKDVCIPALDSTLDNTYSIIDPNSPLVFYAAKRAKGHCSGDTSIACKKSEECGADGPCVPYTAKFAKDDPRNLNKRVHDVYTDLQLNFTKEVGVLAPASIGGAAPPAGGRDYYKCYGVKVVGPKYDGSVIIDTDDAYGSLSSQNLKKVKMVCQSADKDSEGTLFDGTALTCYGNKAVVGGALPETTIDAADGFASGPVTMKKGELFCIPSCIGDGDGPAMFTEHVVKATSLAVGTNGQPGNGLDIDNNPATCSPSSDCSAGIDNALGAIAGLVNMSLADVVASGGVSLLFELDGFTNGLHHISGYIGEQVTPADCTDVNDPNQICSYNVNASALEPGDLCRQQSLISLPVNITGADVPGTALAAGDGGDGSTFTIALAFGGFDLALSIKNVKIRVSMEHDGSHVSSASGILGGGIPVRDLQTAIGQLSGSCVGGANDGAACQTDSQCASNNCVLALSFSPVELGQYLPTLLPVDINLDGSNNCQGGTSMVTPNGYQRCEDVSTCPDPTGTCGPNESISLALKFDTIDAVISGVVE